jgi:hypothetical protein
MRYPVYGCRQVGPLLITVFLNSVPYGYSLYMLSFNAVYYHLAMYAALFVLQCLLFPGISVFLAFPHQTCHNSTLHHIIGK